MSVCPPATAHPSFLCPASRTHLSLVPQSRAALSPPVPLPQAHLPPSNPKLQLGRQERGGTLRRWAVSPVRDGGGSCPERTVALHPQRAPQALNGQPHGGLEGQGPEGSPAAVVLAKHPKVEKRPRTDTPHNLTLRAGVRRETPPGLRFAHGPEGPGVMSPAGPGSHLRQQTDEASAGREP